MSTLRNQAWGLWVEDSHATIYKVFEHISITTGDKGEPIGGPEVCWQNLLWNRKWGEWDIC